jgi:sorbitol/mannitol transport system permease protein
MTRVQAAAPSRPSVDPSVRARSRADGWKRRAPLLPALVFAIVVTQLPFLLTIWYSLHSWNLLRGEEPRFVGLVNFAQMWLDAGFRNAALNTVLMTASAIVFSMITGVALALLVHRKFFGRGVVRTLLITPFLVMPAAAALLWKTSMFDPMFGFVNFVLAPFGVERFDWLTQASIPTIVFIMVWQWTPFMMLIILAGLQSQPDDVLEAAQVDGATSFQIFRYMTLPHLRRYIQLGSILGAIFLLQAFEVIYMTTQGGPGNATTNLPFFLYIKAFRGFEIGQAAALGVVVVGATILVATLSLRIFSRLLEGSKEA